MLIAEPIATKILQYMYGRYGHGKNICSSVLYSMYERKISRLVVSVITSIFSCLLYICLELKILGSLDKGKLNCSRFINLKISIGKSIFAN